MARYYVKGILKDKRKESETIFSHIVYFNDKKMVRKLKPGRFIMVWLPGIDEFPLSPSSYDHESSTVRFTFRVVGLGTKALASLSPGHTIFVRGPYGNGFTMLPITKPWNEKPVLVISGGVGLAPLLPLIKALIRVFVDIHVSCGFKSAIDVFFIDEISKLVGENLTVTTDDGSVGIKGTVVDVVKELLKLKKFSYAFACGPEPMLFKLHKILLSKEVPHQMLIERYVKCALGICGSCVIDGLRLCKEGPVFDDITLRGLSEFGRFKRLASGIREPILDS